jgi:hypothetical protein
LGNSAADQGGGIFNSGTLNVNNTIIAGNHTTGLGGGIYNQNGQVTISACTISGNVAISGSGPSGGGIYNQRGTVTINNSTISDNSAPFGAGVYNNNSCTLTVNNCTISGNVALGSNGNGGGFFNNGTLTVNSSTVSGNSANQGAGLYNTGTLHVNNRDPYGNIDTNYQGTVAFSTLDPAGTFNPTGYTFQPGNMGTALFPMGATLNTGGNTWDITATGTASGITGSAYVTVNNGPAPSPSPGGGRGKVLAPVVAVPDIWAISYLFSNSGRQGHDTWSWVSPVELMPAHLV